MRGHIEARGEGKNRSYRVKVYLGRDANTGKQKFLTHTIHTTKKDAETWLNAKLREIELGEFVAPTTTTVGELLNLWLAGKRGDISDRTYTDYKYAIDTYIRPRLGSIHASVAFTFDTYCHVLPNDQQLATEAMMRVLGCWETGGKQEAHREVILKN
jgi:integrase